MELVAAVTAKDNAFMEKCTVLMSGISRDGDIAHDDEYRLILKKWLHLIQLANTTKKEKNVQDKTMSEIEIMKQKKKQYTKG